MKLSKKILRESKKYKTPFLLFDLNVIRKKYKAIKNSIKGVKIFYAMKANDDPVILKTLASEGSSFEISSLNEMNKLLALNISSSKIICLNPIKNPEFISKMAEKHVDIMAFDSTDEVDKIVKYAPKSKIVLRINVSNEGSDWPLTKKFGVDAIDALPLLRYAKKKNLNPIGVTFHVGSQCNNKNNWASALYVCDDIWQQARKEKINLNFLSLGGGLPVQHLKKIPSVAEIGKVINTVLNSSFKKEKDLMVTIEPGRGLIGDSAVMVTSVVGKADRGEEKWIYIDAGVFNGLMETIQDITYEIACEKKKRVKKVTIGGPSCDSVDIPFKNVYVPDVGVGDRIYLLNAGAYTTVYAANFNGFDIPQMYFLNKK